MKVVDSANLHSAFKTRNVQKRSRDCCHVICHRILTQSCLVKSKLPLIPVLFKS